MDLLRRTYFHTCFPSYLKRWLFAVTSATSILKVMAHPIPQRQLVESNRTAYVFTSGTSLYNPKMPAPTAPAAPNNSSRPTAAVTRAAAPVDAVSLGPACEPSGTVTTGAVKLAEAAVDTATELDPLGLPVWIVTRPVASFSRLARTTTVSLHARAYGSNIPVAGTFSNPAVTSTATGLMVVKYPKNPGSKSSSPPVVTGAT